MAKPSVLGARNLAVEITNESRVAVLGAWICAIGRQGGNPRQSRRPLLIIRNGAENSLATRREAAAGTRLPRVLRCWPRFDARRSLLC